MLPVCSSKDSPNVYVEFNHVAHFRAKSLVYEWEIELLAMTSKCQCFLSPHIYFLKIYTTTGKAYEPVTIYDV